MVEILGERSLLAVEDMRAPVWGAVGLAGGTWDREGEPKMRVGLSLRPGQDGTKRLLARYGKQLVCVRYRYDEQTKQRLKTVELIVERTEWDGKSRNTGAEAVVAVRVDWWEKDVQRQVKVGPGIV